MKRRKLRLSPRAQDQLRAASDWWQQNRFAAPTAFNDDLEVAFDLIRKSPGVGQPVEHSTYEEVRRIYLNRVRYYLFYRVADDEVEVLDAWHGSRGDAPPL